MITNDSPVILTVAEAARLLRICPNSVRAAIQRGEIPCLRIGRRILIPRAALDALLAGRLSPSPARPAAETTGQPESRRSARRTWEREAGHAARRPR